MNADEIVVGEVQGGRRVANGEQVQSVAMANKPSVDFTGYWQRRAA
jgi:hypothetical protein